VKNQEDGISKAVKLISDGAEAMSPRLHLGTREGLVLMRELGFKRSEFSISTDPDKKQGGWKNTRIHIASVRSSAVKRAYKNKEMFLMMGWEGRFYSHQNPALNFVIFERTGTEHVSFQRKLMKKNGAALLEISWMKNYAY